MKGGQAFILGVFFMILIIIVITLSIPRYTEEIEYSGMTTLIKQSLNNIHRALIGQFMYNTWRDWKKNSFRIESLKFKDKFKEYFSAEFEELKEVFKAVYGEKFDYNILTHLVSVDIGEEVFGGVTIEYLKNLTSDLLIEMKLGEVVSRYDFYYELGVNITTAKSNFKPRPWVEIDVEFYVNKSTMHLQHRYGILLRYEIYILNATGKVEDFSIELVRTGIINSTGIQKIKIFIRPEYSLKEYKGKLGIIVRVEDSLGETVWCVAKIQESD